MDGQKPISMTAYYGCMYAFVKVFKGEIRALRDLAAHLQGDDAPRAFGWKRALDRARGRAVLAAARWDRLNQGLEERLNEDAFERRIYGRNAHDLKVGSKTARTLREALRRLNRYVEQLRFYDAEAVRSISQQSDQMMALVGEFERVSELVAGYLQRGAADDGGRVGECLREFLRVQDEFRAGLEPQTP